MDEPKTEFEGHCIFMPISNCEGNERTSEQLPTETPTRSTFDIIQGGWLCAQLQRTLLGWMATPPPMQWIHLPLLVIRAPDGRWKELERLPSELPTAFNIAHIASCREFVGLHSSSQLASWLLPRHRRGWVRLSVCGTTHVVRKECVTAARIELCCCRRRFTLASRWSCPQLTELAAS